MGTSSSGIRAGGAFVELSAQSGPLERALKLSAAKVSAFAAGVQQAGGRIAGIGKAMLAFGGSAVAGFGAALYELSAFGDELLKMSQRTGMSVESLSALSFAAEVDLGVLEASLRKLAVNLVKAVEGSAEAQQSFAQLGLDWRRLAEAKPEEQLLTIGEALSRIRNPAQRAATAVAILGKSGTMLLPLFEGGRRGIQELMAKAESLGLVMSRDDAAAADDFRDSIEWMGKAIRSAATTIVSAVLPGFQDFASSVIQIVKRMKEWIAQHKPLVDLLSRGLIAVVALGAALLVLGSALQFVGFALGGVAGAFMTLGKVVGAVATPVKLLAGLLGSMIGPFGIVLVAVAAATVLFLNWGSVAGTVFDFLGRGFAYLANVVSETVKGMFDALAAGDIALAGQILWAQLRVQWIKGSNAVLGTWYAWSNAIRGGFQAVSIQIASGWINLWSGLQTIMTNGIAFFRDAWSGMLLGLKTGLNNFGGFFAKIWERIKAQFSGEAAAGLEQRLAQIDAETNRKNEALYNTTGETVLGRGNDAQQRLAQIEADRQAAQESLRAQLDAGTEARRKAAEDGLAAAQAELQAAQGELSGLLGKAADGKARAVQIGQGPQAGLGEFDLGAMSLARTIESKGTFNAAAVRGLSSGDSVTDAVKGVEGQAKKTNEKLDEIKRQLAFGGRLS